MQRFYLKDLQTSDYNFVLRDKDMIHQLIKVLRVRVWESVIFFDGSDNYDYIFRVKNILDKSIEFEQIDRKENNSEIDFELNLYQAIPNKIEKIEYIIQKWVEIWVKNFVFFRSERSQKLVLSDNKIDRLQKIAIEAVEQSGRLHIPEIVFLEKYDFSPLIKNQNIVFHTIWESSKTLKKMDFDYKNTINLFIWPEWGFSDEELKKFENMFFYRVHLWDRILRTETAGVSSAFYIIQNK